MAFEKTKGPLQSLFKAEKRPGSPSDLTAGNDLVDPRNTFTPDIENRPPEEVASFVTFLHDRFLNHRRAYDPVWYTSLAFWLGQQWAEWDPIAARLEVKKKPSWRRRLTINRCMPTVATLQGKINRSAQKASALPLVETSTSYADARMGEKVLRALHMLISMGEPIDEAIDWMLICGTGFTFIGFDPDLGETIYLPDGTTMKTGEVCVEGFGPFEALAPSDSTGFRKPTRFIRARMIDVERLKKQYGDAARALVPDSIDVGDDQAFKNQAMSLISPLSAQGAVQADEAQNAAYIVELYEDPEVMHEDDAQRYSENGRQIVLAYRQNIILYDGPNPFESPLPSQSRIPMAIFRDIHKPGTFFGSSRIEQLVPIQENYNTGRSQMVENRDLTCRPALNIEQGHGINFPVVRPGSLLERTRGTQPPSFLEPPKMGEYHVRDVLEATPEDFQLVSQIVEVARGEVPYSNMPGFAINLLQQAADTPLAGVSKSVANGLTRTFTFAIARVRQFWDEPRMLTYLGENNKEDVFLFIAQNHQTPLLMVVRPEDVFPESKAAIQARVQEDVKAGILDPIRDRETILRLLEYGNYETIWSNDDLDRQNAQWENRMMAEQPGLVSSVQDFDNHQIHLTFHRRFQKTPEWRGLSDASKAGIAQHVEMTIAALAEEVGAIAGVTGPGMPEEEPGGQPGPMPGEGVM